MVLAAPIDFYFSVGFWDNFYSRPPLTTANQFFDWMDLLNQRRA